MKKCLIIIFTTVTAILLSCKSQTQIPKDSTNETAAAATANDTVRIANDELEYEIIIIDPGFNTWLASRARPRGYYSQQYFEAKNRIWVIEWNIRAMRPQQYRDLYLMQIDYDHHIDYGYEVNYMLYNYLVYFQLTTGQRLGGIVPQI